MKINLTIENDDGEVLLESSAPSFELAVDKLYDFQRYQEREAIKRQESETDTLNV